MSVSLDPYILGKLMADLVGHDRQPSVLRAYLTPVRRASGRRAPRPETAAHTLLEHRRTHVNAAAVPPLSFGFR